MDLGVYKIFLYLLLHPVLSAAQGGMELRSGSPEGEALARVKAAVESDAARLIPRSPDWFLPYFSTAPSRGLSFSVKVGGTFTASPYSDIWIPLTDCLVPSGCIHVSQTWKGKDNAITTDLTEGIHDEWERALSPQSQFTCSKMGSTSSRLGSPALEALPSLSPSEASKYDA